jgi:hypothetical protein
MKKRIGIIAISCIILLTALPTIQANAQIPIVSIITSAIKKVIVAIDLKVQQMQNKTLWLQNAQKELETKMSQLQLNDISDWANKQKKLYSDYYQELQKVKSVISTYQQVKDITQQQLQLVKEYNTAYSQFKQDKNFSASEINYMGQVYNGILSESVQNLNELLLAINSFTTTMADAKRLEIISSTAKKMNNNLTDLRKFNNQNRSLTMQRAKENNDVQTTQQLYGLPKN